MRTIRTPILALTGLFFALAGAANAQNTGTMAPKNAARAPRQYIPVTRLSFTKNDVLHNVSMSPITAMLPECTSNGAIFIDEVNPKNLTSHTVLMVHGDVTHTYSPASIPDLHDIFYFDFFPSRNGVALLVRGTKHATGHPEPGLSPAGVAWRHYHYFIAEFDRDGTFKKLIRIPVNYPIRRMAILGSGGFVVAGYDRINSAGHLLVLDSTGDVETEIPLPAFQTPVEKGAPFGSAQSFRDIAKTMGSIVFTSYGDDILAWQTGTNGSIVDIGDGGGYRIVPLQPPPGMTFMNMVPAPKQWIALYRKNGVANVPFNQTDFAYYDISPIDGSVTGKLIQSGKTRTQYISCAEDDSYLAIGRSKHGHLILRKAEK